MHYDPGTPADTDAAAQPALPEKVAYDPPPSAVAASPSEILLADLLSNPDHHGKPEVNKTLRWPLGGYNGVEIIADFAPEDVGPPDARGVRSVVAQFFGSYHRKDTAGKSPFFDRDHRGRNFEFSWKRKQTKKPLKMSLYFVGERFSGARIHPLPARGKRTIVKAPKGLYAEVELRDIVLGFGINGQRLTEIEQRLIIDPNLVVTYAMLVCDGRCGKSQDAPPPSPPPEVEITFRRNGVTITDAVELSELIHNHELPDCLAGHGINIEIQSDQDGAGAWVQADRFDPDCEGDGIRHQPEQRLVTVELDRVRKWKSTPPQPQTQPAPPATGDDCAELAADTEDDLIIGAPACLESFAALHCHVKGLESDMSKLEERFAPLLKRFGDPDGGGDPCRPDRHGRQPDRSEQASLRNALVFNDLAITAERNCFDAVDRWLTGGLHCDRGACPKAAMERAARFIIDQADGLDRRLAQVARRHLDAALTASALRRYEAATTGFCSYTNR